MWTSRSRSCAPSASDFINDDYHRLSVRAGQRYTGRDYAVEADASNASYFLAAAAVTGGRSHWKTSAPTPSRAMRALWTCWNGWAATSLAAPITVTGPETLRAIDVDMEAIPDMAQTLAVICAFADGPSRLTGLPACASKKQTGCRPSPKNSPNWASAWRKAPTSGHSPARRRQTAWRGDRHL